MVAAFMPPSQEGHSAISVWREAVRLTGDHGAGMLGDIYRSFHPTQGELIFTGACSFQCAHCIYPPSFARHNRSMPADQWVNLLTSLSRDGGIDTFVYGGRSVNADAVALMQALRQQLPDSLIGMIDNGISLLPHLESLRAVRADWFDVSLDGMAADHDRQRGRLGSYGEGLRGALRLKDEGFAPRVNILVCLTTINYRSVCQMIREVNTLGFKNFFITPITLAGETGPSPELRLSREQLAWFVRELQATVPDLDDAWVEMLLFSADYALDFASAFRDLWAAGEDGRDEIAWDLGRLVNGAGSANALFIRYYPLSLTGIRELIVNTDGNVIVPKAMASGRVADEAVLGSLVRESAIDLLNAIPDRRAFEYYRSELALEALLLRSVI